MSATAATQPKDPAARLRQLVLQTIEKSPPPAVFTKIVEVANDPRASVADLKRVVQYDPVLTSRVIRTINSAYYGLSKPTSDLQYAIALLGFTTIRNLALTALVGNMFKRESTIDVYSSLGLWQHIISVALTSRLIVRRTMDSVLAEDAYLGGLLHDVGILLFDQHDRRIFRQIVARIRPDRELHLCEREVVGFDHAEFGAAVAAEWRFPGRLVECFRWHHAAHRSSQEARPIVSAVELANFLCNHKGINSVDVKYALRLRSALLADLGLTPQDLRGVWQEMHKELAAARDLFDL